MNHGVDYSRLFHLDDKRAVVVGAGSGLGREAALALVAHGASVICVDRDAAAAEETATLCQKQLEAGNMPQAHQQERDIGGREAVVRAEVLDVTDAAAVAAAPQRFGHPDVLIHTPAMNVRKPILEYSSQEVDSVIDLNLKATFWVLRAFGESMVQRQRGSVVVLSSIRSRVVEPGQGVYGATKAAVESLVRSAASEFSSHGVRVNAVAPGVVATPLTQQVRDDAEWNQRYISQSAIGRWAQPEELVGALVYLASDAASYVTGSVLTVDGGWTAVDGGTSQPASLKRQ